MEFIDKNMTEMAVDDIAKYINRTVNPVRRYIREKKAKRNNPFKDEEYLLNKLHSRYYWPELNKQFSQEELQFFEHEWIQYYKQFSEDVTATEENEMIELIRVSILLNRIMRDKQEIIKNIQRIEKLIELEMSKPPDRIDTLTLSNLQTQIGGFIAAKATFIKEYDTLTGKKEKFTRELKGTREARLRKAEDAKTNFNAYLRYLDTEDIRNREGAIMEKMAKAADNSAVRLGEYHEFKDGYVDQPLFNADTVRDE
jgi:hypothetical protein